MWSRRPMRKGRSWEKWRLGSSSHVSVLRSVIDDSMLFFQQQLWFYLHLSPVNWDILWSCCAGCREAPLFTQPWFSRESWRWRRSKKKIEGGWRLAELGNLRIFWILLLWTGIFHRIDPSVICLIKEARLLKEKNAVIMTKDFYINFYCFTFWRLDIEGLAPLLQLLFLGSWSWRMPFGHAISKI